MHQQQPQNEFPSFADSVNLFYGATGCAAWLIRPFIRFGIGTQAPGYYGVFAFLGVAWFAANDAAVAAYFALWLVALAVQRFVAWRRWRRGWGTHSGYQGFPVLGSFFGLIRSERIARAMETPLCGFVAALSVPMSEPLALVLFAGVAGNFLANVMDENAMHARLRRVRDARAEAEAFTRMLRNDRNFF